MGSEGECTKHIPLPAFFHGDRNLQMKERPNPDTIREYLRRLGHRVALVGLKPIGDAPKSTVIWPIEQNDAVDQACGLSDHYYSVYVNLNPLADYMHQVSPDPG